MIITPHAWIRKDGRKGIRNTLVIAYLVECAHHVAQEIAHTFRDHEVHVIGFSGCYPNLYSLRMMEALCTHPNVGGVLLVSLGCEGFDRNRLMQTVRESGREVQILGIQSCGGTRKTIESGVKIVGDMLHSISQGPQGEMKISELVVGTVCGGSDATSGITANPGIGRAFDLLVKESATCIFEETGELIGCEQIMVERACTPELGEILKESVEKAARYYTLMGHGSFAPGNADGGLTTQEEKSMGAYAKSGDSPIHGLIKPGDIPKTGGLYLLDVVPDGEPRFGFPNINDSAEIAELMACGSHIILFSTGRGSVVGSAISPVIKVCANPETYRCMSEDMDVDGGAVLEGRKTLDQCGEEIFQFVKSVAAGEKSASERLRHREFVLTYKNFEPIGPACHPTWS